MAADEFFLDPRAVRRSFDRASRTYDAAAAVQAEIRTRLLERLDVVRLQPTAVLDLGAGTGHASRASASIAIRSAQVVAARLLAVACCGRARASSASCVASRRVCADAHRLPLRSQSFDLVLQQSDAASGATIRTPCSPKPPACCARRACSRSRRSGRIRLREVRELWRGIDPFTHVHRFIDMHDLGDALMRAGFAEPVMDTERLTVTYSDLSALVAEIRRQRLAQHRAAAGRAALTGRARGAAVRSRSAELVRNGPLRDQR